MWSTILAINSFVVVPVSLVFVIYSLGQGIFLWQWKLFVIALVILAITIIAQVVIGILAEG